MSIRKFGRNADGTFAPGNSGKPRGTRNKVTRVVETLLEGEADALTRRVVQAALNGDMVAMRLCLERIAPPRKDLPVHFELPAIRSIQDAERAARSVLNAVVKGNLTPIEGSRIMTLAENYRRILETSDLEARIVALEGLKSNRS